MLLWLATATSAGRPSISNITLSLQLPMKFGLYRIGGNLIIFNKDYDTMEKANREGSCSKYTAFPQLLYTLGGNQARLYARTEFEISQCSLKGGWKHKAVPVAVDYML